MSAIMVTGSAGFIGFHLSQRLLDMGCQVVGLDNMNSYYDPNLKLARTEILRKYPNFSFSQIDLSNKAELDRSFQEFKIDRVINLAAQAGVRYSLVNPNVYAESNLQGFLNILECCRHAQISHLVYASSSSVYGANTKLPFSVEDNVDHPISLYAATKKCNELMAHAYSHLFHISTTGLRFFTVYGPWGRPDMALFKFAKAILNGDPIDLYNFGNMKRDFTYIDDIVEGVVRILFKPAESNPQWDGHRPDPSSSKAPWRVYNIGNNTSVDLLYVVKLLEQELGMEARKNFLPLQAGDVEATYADTDSLSAAIDFRPRVSIEEGVRNFAAWYKSYYSRQG